MAADTDNRNITMRTDNYWFAALILALGLVLAAFVMAGAVRDFRMANRFVEVKGLSEREIPADLAIWPITYNLATQSLDALRRQLDQADEAIMAYLKLRGFDDAEITRSPPQINDQWSFASGNQRPENRYTATRTLTLRTHRVDAARQALQDAAELISQGVVLSQTWDNSVQFLFTGLEDVKPEMIAEATADARRAAGQFAEDSGSRVGGIKTARQGFFSITEADPSTPEMKTVRVVTTVEYFLED